jgi:hypothetical protein
MSLNKTRIKLYNTLALQVLSYGSETCTIKAKDARRITAAEIKQMRRTAGYICTDYKTNTHISKELKITTILEKLLEYKFPGKSDPSGETLLHFLTTKFPFKKLTISFLKTRRPDRNF